MGAIKYCFLGKVTARQWKNQPFYYLEINSESLFSNSSEIIYAFANLVSKEIWTTLAQRTFSEKKYSFWCEKRTRGWRLKDWTEIKEEKNKLI